MKQLTCEMCGGTDLLKQDGVFVCQTCGCKYSVEEAKKMMVEGTVEVQGTVKIDNSSLVEKYLANARRAKEKEDWGETEKYYNMVEQNDPDNIEAIFYSAYGKAKSTLVESDIFKRQAAFKVLKNCISIIDDHYKPENRKENREAIISMAADLGNMITSDFVFTATRNGYGVVTSTNKDETYALFSDLIYGFKESVNNIQKIDDQVYLHQALISLFTTAKLVNWPMGWHRIDSLDRFIREQQSALETIRKKQIDAYWGEHKEDKEKLDKTRDELSKQIAAVIASIPEGKNKIEMEQQLATLEEELKKIGGGDFGGFGFGKSAKIGRQINEVKEKLKICNDILAPQINPLQAQIDEIDNMINTMPFQNENEN